MIKDKDKKSLDTDVQHEDNKEKNIKGKLKELLFGQTMIPHQYLPPKNILRRVTHHGISVD